MRVLSLTGPRWGREQRGPQGIKTTYARTRVPLSFYHNNALFNNKNQPQGSIMSTLTFHRIALVPIILGLKNTHAFLTKSMKHAEENNVDLNEYATATLIPDQYNLIKQVQRQTDAAKFIPERSNPDAPRFSNPDTETTYPELLERVQRTIDYLESVDPKFFEGREDVQIEMNVGPVTVEYSVSEYVTQFAHPNFWWV